MKLSRTRLCFMFVTAFFIAAFVAGASAAHDYSAPIFYMAGVYSQSKPNYPPATDEEMTWLLKQITDDDRGTRAIAAGALGQTCDKRAAEPLLKALSDKSASVRMNAAMSFVHVKDARAVKPLAAMMLDPEAGYTLVAAAYALAAQGDDGVVALMSARSDPNYPGAPVEAEQEQNDAQLSMALLVGMGQEAYTWAKSRLKSTTPQLRSAALSVIRHLSRSDEGRAQIAADMRGIDDPALNAILAPSEHQANAPKKPTAKEISALVRKVQSADRADAVDNEGAGISAYEAAETLAQAGSTEAIGALVKLASGKGSRASSAAIRSLGESKSPLAREALLKLSKSTSRALRDRASEALLEAADPALLPCYVSLLSSNSEDIVDSTIVILGRMHDARATKHLIPMLARPKHRIAAISALAAIKDPTAIDPLVALLKTNDKNKQAMQNVREAVTQALAAQKDPRAKSALISALKDASPRVRRAAAFALAKWLDKDVYEAMGPMLKDKDRDVRACAAVVRGQMGDAQAASEVIRILNPNPEEDSPALDLTLPAMRAAGALKEKRAVTPILCTLGEDIPMSTFNDAGEDVYAQSRTTKLDALKAITGRDFGDGYYRWMAYWVAQGNSVGLSGEPDPYEEELGDFSEGQPKVDEQ